MKRVLIGVGLLALLVVVGLGAIVANTFMGRRAVQDGAEINGARIVADGIVSAAVIPLGEGHVALVDAGNDAEAKALLADLSRRGLNPDAVSAILLTHGHADHIGGVRRFPRAQVMALEAEVPLVEGRVGARGPATRLMPVSPTGIQVSRPLHDGDVVDLGGTTARVYAVGGHTAGSAAYLINGLLFVGDSADTASDGHLLPSAWIFSDSQADNRASLGRLASRLRADGASVQAIVPAHSGVMTDGLAALEAWVRDTGAR